MVKMQPGWSGYPAVKQQPDLSWKIFLPGRASSLLPKHPPVSLVFTCQQICLNRDHEFRRGPKLNIITIMTVLIRWKAAPQGKRCTIDYTLAFRANWLSDRVDRSLARMTRVFFAPILLPKSDGGTVFSSKALKMSHAATRSVYRV